MSFGVHDADFLSISLFIDDITLILLRLKQSLLLLHKNVIDYK